jgi:hypothetical protein
MSIRVHIVASNITGFTARPNATFSANISSPTSSTTTFIGATSLMSFALLQKRRIVSRDVSARLRSLLLVQNLRGMYKCLGIFICPLAEVVVGKAGL